MTESRETARGRRMSPHAQRAAAAAAAAVRGSNSLPRAQRRPLTRPPLAALALALVIAAAALRTAEAAWSPMSIFTQSRSARYDKRGASDNGDVCSNTSALCSSFLLRASAVLLRACARQRAAACLSFTRHWHWLPSPAPLTLTQLHNADIYTKPSLAKVQVCSRSVAVSQNGGGAASSGTKSSFAISKVASTACAEAVNDGAKKICAGRDPVATISSMASTCASAIAEMQASTISGAEVKAATYPPKDWTKSAFTSACTRGCANGQVAAEAVAQASACAFTAQTKGCNAVKTSLSQQAYSSAFVQTTARAWSNACALGFGKAHGEGEALAKTLVTVLSRAFGDVVAAACSECDSCKCASLPGGLTYDKLKGASDTSAAAANARFTMARALSSAAATYCASDRKPRVSGRMGSVWEKKWDGGLVARDRSGQGGMG